MARSVKQRDFDYYITNLDWGDGTELDREITQFTRNDVFEHTYEKPGFYSIKGLIFKYNELGIEVLGEPNNNMSAAGGETENYNHFTGHPQEGQEGSRVKTTRTVTHLSSSMSQIKVRPMQGGSLDNYLDSRYEIVEMFKSNTPISIAQSGFEDHLQNSVVVELEKRPNTDGNQANDRLPGVSLNIPIQLDVSKIDHFNYSFELNLPNPNLSVSSEPTQYKLREKLYPSKGGEDVGKVDWGAAYVNEKILTGVGGSSNDPNRSTNVKNGGWQRVQGTLFVQDRATEDSSGEEIPDSLESNIIYMLIEIFPRNYANTPQGTDKEYIGIRNISYKFPNTENVVRPVEWQRFYSNIVVNPREDYDSPLYEENDFAMIGGLSKESTHYKSLASMLAYDIVKNEYKSSIKPDYNEYDLISMYDTFAKYDEKLYNDFLEPYVKNIHEDYAPYWNEIKTEFNTGQPTTTQSGSLYDKPKINSGMFNKKFHGVFQNTYITDVDIATTKMYKGVKPMWEQLGFDNFEYDNPSLNGYWKNIIPKDFQLDDRAGIIKQDLPDPERGALTPRISREEYVFISGSDQEWDDGYYWPVLPLINHVGIFEADVDTSLYGDELIAKITNTIDGDDTLIFNLNFDVDEVEELQDSSDKNTIRYSTDSLLLLDDNDRIFKDMEDITDTIEKSIDRQAF